jgi:hypothetical protein
MYHDHRNLYYSALIGTCHAGYTSDVLHVLENELSFMLENRKAEHTLRRADANVVESQWATALSSVLGANVQPNSAN